MSAPTPLDPDVNLSLLATMQQQATDRLTGDAYFTDIPVVNETIKDIESQIEMSLKKIGICVLVLTPEASVNNQQDVPYPYFDKISLVVQIVEHPTINRSSAGTGKYAVAVAEHVAILLHAFKPTIGNEYYLDNPSITLVPDDNFLVYQVRFGTAGGIKPVTLDDRNDIPPVAPYIVQQPSDSTLPPRHFTVVASGTTPLFYQWEEFPVGATGWHNLVNGGDYSNVTTATLSLVDDPLLTGNLYRVQVSNVAGSVLSNQATFV